jgi:hypothetical protein
LQKPVKVVIIESTRKRTRSLVRQRRIGTWRQETAAEARKAVHAFRSGKLKIQPADSLVASLRNSN